MCKNAQYDKDVIKKRTEACLNFQVKMQGQNYVIVVGITKSKHSEELEGKLRLKLQVTHVCEFHFNITDINVSGDQCSSIIIYLHQKEITRKSTKTEIS